jgi:hypothetical protein
MLSLLNQARSSSDTPPKEPLSISITNKYGDVFTNLTVSKILGDGLVLEHKAGQLKVRYADLPQALREKYQPLAAAAQDKDKNNADATAALIAVERRAQAEQARLRAAQEQQQLRQEAARRARIEIPGQGWSITVLNMGLREVGRHLVEGQFVCQAIGPNGFNLSIWVENPAGTGTQNSDVFNYYWAKASRNPLMDQKSIRTETNGNFVKVAYSLSGIPNVNYYFAFKGKWVDVHISKSSATSEANRLFADFEQVLAYGE